MAKAPKTGNIGPIVKPVAGNQRLQSNRRGALKAAAKTRKTPGGKRGK